MVTTHSRLAYFVEHRPVRDFVIDDFRNPRREAEITGVMPDYADFCEKRQLCRAELKSVAPELRAFYQEPLLTKVQEQHLFRQFNYFKFHFVKSLDAHANFNDEKGIVEYSDAIIGADVAALEKYHFLATQIKQQLVSCNTRLVMNIAKKQKEFWNGNGGIDLLTEIVAEGNVGLVRAVDYFDFRKGFKFSTYATWAIIDTIIKARENRQKAETIMTGCDEFFEQILDDREPFVREQSERAAFVSQALKKINLRQQKVLKEYFERGRTLQAIAEDLCISKERVRQLRDKGLLAIKEKLEEANYAP